MKYDYTMHRTGAFPDIYGSGECPERVLDEIFRNHLPSGHVITFANEKGGVGKTTMAFQAGVALASRGLRVLAVDLDARQRSLSRTLEARHATAHCLNAKLPAIQSIRIDNNSTAMLQQEIARLGSEIDVVIIDVAGRDCPQARRAIALADTLVTPISASHYDLDALGHFDPVTHELREPSAFARTVLALRAEQLARGLSTADWVVARNRVRSVDSAQMERIGAGLLQLSESYSLRIVEGLSERVVYRDLLQFGLTVADIPLIPQLRKHARKGRQEIDRVLATFDLPEPPETATLHRSEAAPARRAPVLNRTRDNYVRAVLETLCPTRGPARVEA
ncbi:ATPase [Altererythrobacter sp. FM1]|uniref:division plane positioning ATPase MipZ n=1 Tax=Tsuneonella flava TaxID=2055955 RepID=UPI000C7FE97F|nr:division plane positioning ATPase MipZ [Tsuneonella flava]ROT93338.1 ATPase [Altererythrobacter sp. FM1]